MRSVKPSAQKQPDLSIVIPAYREEKRIGHTLDELAVFLQRDKFFKLKAVEVVVVAADAPDKTHEIVVAKQTLFQHFVFLKSGPVVGKGRDVQFGMLRAAGKITVFMDADLATPLHHLKQFYEACAGGYDVVIGTRNLLTYRSNVVRGIFASVGNLLYRLASGIWIEDTQCGFKMFNKRACTLCFSKLTILGWGFDIEILAIARTNGLKLKSFRIDDYKHMPFSTHTEGMVKITVRTVRDFGQIMINRLSSVYIVGREG
jgi:dolichyl-phosphate beta-glucosyltransferase